MNVTLRELQTFLVVAETCHFRRSAEQLHLTAPAVSRHVSELEAKLGLTLFDRKTREVHLTPAGNKMRGRLIRIMGDLEMMLEEARIESKGLHGVVRVASGPTPSAALIPSCIAKCAVDFPDISVLSCDRVQTDVIRMVMAGEVDFGLAIDPEENPRMITKKIMDDKFVWVTYRDHPTAQQASIKWEQLEKEPLVLLDHSSGSRRLIDAAFLQRHLSYRVAQEAGHTTTVFRMVEARLGSTISPALSMPLSPNLVVRPLIPTVHRTVRLIRCEAYSLSPAAQRVWKAVEEINAQHH